MRLPSLEMASSAGSPVIVEPSGIVETTCVVSVDEIAVVEGERAGVPGWLELLFGAEHEVFAVRGERLVDLARRIRGPATSIEPFIPWTRLPFGQSHRHAGAAVCEARRAVVRRAEGVVRQIRIGAGDGRRRTGSPTAWSPGRPTYLVTHPFSPSRVAT